MSMGMHEVTGKLSALSPMSLHALFALALAAAAVVGRHTNLEASSLALVWPAAGVSFLWGLWALRSRGDLALALAVTVPVLTFVNLATGLSIVLSVGVAVGNTVQTMVAVYLFRRMVPERGINTVGEFFRLGLVAFVSCTVGALFLVLANAVNGAVDPFAVLIPWLVRHSVSLTALGSLGIVAWSAIRSPAVSGTMDSTAQRTEYALLALATVLIYVVTFGTSSSLPIAYVTIPVHMWAGLRLRPGWAMLHGVVCGAFLVVFTLRGLGPFQELDDEIAAYVGQSFMFIAFTLATVLALSMDERRRLIQRLYVANEEAQASADLRDLVISKMNDGVFVSGPDKALLFQNATSERWLGPLDRKAEDRFKPYQLTTPDGESLGDAENPLTLALQGVVTERMDLDLRRESGEVVHLSVDAMPLPGERGAVVVTRNVTHERVYQRDLGRFASVVAHDLLTPLTVFDGWLELLEDDDVPSAERQASVGRLQQASLRMRSQIRNLLAYSLAKEDRLMASRIDVAQVVRGIIDLRTSLPGAQPSTVHFEVDAPHSVYVDERLFLQLMENLVGNAIKYGRTDGTGAVTVSSTLDGSTGRTLIQVADNGIGVPEADLARVFDEFHRSENGLGKASGTGLGLAICRRIAESHGGSISVRNRESGGARFTVSLPSSPDQLPGGLPLVAAGRTPRGTTAGQDRPEVRR